MSLSTLTISNQKLEKLRALLVVPHDHYDGQNECRFCDRSVLDLAIEKIESLEVIVKTQQKQIDRLLTARDAEAGKRAHFEEALLACEKASGFVEKDTPLAVHIARIVAEWEQLKARSKP